MGLEDVVINPYILLVGDKEIWKNIKNLYLFIFLLLYLL